MTSVWATCNTVELLEFRLGFGKLVAQVLLGRLQPFDLTPTMMLGAGLSMVSLFILRNLALRISPHPVEHIHDGRRLLLRRQTLSAAVLGMHGNVGERVRSVSDGCMC